MAADLTSVPQSDPLRVYRYRDGLYAADLLTAAVVYLDFFTWLGANPSTKEEICARFEFAERPTDVMLTLLAANGFVERLADGKFHTTLTAKEHLTAGSPWCLSPYYASLKDRPITQDYLKVLSTGRPANWGGDKAAQDWHKAMETDAFSRSFTAAMDCRGFYLGQALAKKVDLGGRKHLLDIGGGSGIYSCSLVAHHAELKATVFEQAPVDRITQRCIVERGYPDRVFVATGDMFNDPLPTDADVHLFSNVLHDWDYPEVRELLAISHKALAPGGLLIIHDAFINEAKNGPLPVAEYSALLMHSTQGKCYGVGEYAELLREAGFEPGAYHDTAADRGFMTAIRR
ncbi:methyltransferase [Verrucomicrobium spinosum]|uniref:methyltransferase n=1 Tax=Verrucomicrobium spinosum TaxID=2736 RepID=UPI0001744D7B|nr:methyltransferase [Verrucomicrobium spinosum]